MSNVSNGIVHIVDDDEAIRDSLLFLMEAEGIPATSYESAQQFLDTCEKASPSCVLVDMRMPGISGIQLYEKLIEKNIPIPVILMTGHGDRRMAEEALHAGVFDFLIKPFDNTKLIQLVRLCLTKKSEIITYNELT